MITVRYRVADSTIPGAGKGLFVAEAVPTGRVLVAPSHINATVPLAELLADDNHPLADSSIRWFEDYCTVSPDWPDECYINHAFDANGLWHLGFVFAARDIAAGEELCVDYRHLIGPGVQMPFRDARTGQAIIGHAWGESLRLTSQALCALAQRL